MADGVNGRDGRGRFGPGNQAAQGRPNPHARRVAELRAAFMSAVSTEDIRAVVEALFGEAKAGSVPAARELLTRVLGQPEAVDVLERVEELEALLEGGAADRGER